MTPIVLALGVLALTILIAHHRDVLSETVRAFLTAPFRLLSAGGEAIEELERSVRNGSRAIWQVISGREYSIFKIIGGVLIGGLCIAVTIGDYEMTERTIDAVFDDGDDAACIDPDATPTSTTTTLPSTSAPFAFSGQAPATAPTTLPPCAPESSTEQVLRTLLVAGFVASAAGSSALLLDAVGFSGFFQPIDSYTTPRHGASEGDAAPSRRRFPVPWRRATGPPTHSDSRRRKLVVALSAVLLLCVLACQGGLGYFRYTTILDARARQAATSTAELAPGTTVTTTTAPGAGEQTPTSVPTAAAAPDEGFRIGEFLTYVGIPMTLTLMSAATGWGVFLLLAIGVGLLMYALAVVLTALTRATRAVSSIGTHLIDTATSATVGIVAAVGRGWWNFGVRAVPVLTRRLGEIPEPAVHDRGVAGRNDNAKGGGLGGQRNDGTSSETGSSAPDALPLLGGRWQVVQAIRPGVVTTARAVDRSNADEEVVAKYVFYGYTDPRNEPDDIIRLAINQFNKHYHLQAVSSRFVINKRAADKDGSYRFIILDYHSRGDLTRALPSAVSLETILDLVDDVLNGLYVLRSAATLVHLDINPTNIVLDSEGRAVVIDLGIAIRPKAVDKLTQPRTIAFCSPEQLTRGAPLTSFSDIYSVGATLFWMLTGLHPYERDADNDYEVGYKKGEGLTFTPVRGLVPGMPEVIDDLITQWLSFEPRERADGRGDEVSLDSARRDLARCRAVLTDDELSQLYYRETTEDGDSTMFPPDMEDAS